MIQAEEKLSRLLSDSNRPKLKKVVKTKTEEGVWIQCVKVARPGRFERPTSCFGELRDDLLLFQNA
jgi:hypothetical protein